MVSKEVGGVLELKTQFKICGTGASHLSFFLNYEMGINKATRSAGPRRSPIIIT